ncbi:MAG: AAA family ATPase [Clostridia bacterium]|nr:AAA family ATPase [Clostridia bacterium]MBQ9721540.1 AAA family ATPase [Oscillospiraceae bacterium]
MDACDILRNLQEKKNVLLMGAPGTGKSKLMNDVARLFERGVAIDPMPTHHPGAAIPIPAIPENENLGALPMLQRPRRKVFRTTLHQNSKYRDFLTGITPRYDGTEGYQISEGILYRANEFAKQPDSAALLIIDELNRGPAIEVFGGSIVTIEPDKRLGDDNTPAENTQFFEILSPETDGYIEYAFSPHLYILAAMNQADVSVAPLDVAFMRRWMSVKLAPDYAPAYARFGGRPDDVIPNENPSARDVYNAAIKALEAINKKIVIGRGPEYQLGQGILLSILPRGSGIDDALDFVLDVWSMIYAHIEELFFGEPVAMAYILNSEREDSPYFLNEVYFAGETKFVLSHTAINRSTVYGLYRSLLEGDDA